LNIHPGYFAMQALHHVCKPKRQNVVDNINGPAPAKAVQRAEIGRQRSLIVEGIDQDKIGKGTKPILNWLLGILWRASLNHLRVEAMLARNIIGQIDAGFRLDCDHPRSRAEDGKADCAPSHAVSDDEDALGADCVSDLSDE
jgi:hypothetical protein